MRLGYFLSSEEYTPHQLLDQAVRAQEAGFDTLWISDHFHPWNDEQGQSPFVWSMIGALARETDLPVATGVTCPTTRIHPAVIAQAAATCAVLLGEGRFRLGVGTGEALNEHILGTVWPAAAVRLEMLEEAVEVIRTLWQGDVVEHRGKHYTVENARIYTLPEQAPEILVSAMGPKAAKVAARIGDGLVTTKPDDDVIGTFRDAGGGPVLGGFKVGYAPTEEEGVLHAHRLWANSGLPGELAQVLPTPAHFEQASSLVTMQSTRTSVVCGPEVDRHVEQFDAYRTAGFEEIYVANIGPFAGEMLRVYGEEVLPAVRARVHEDPT